MAIAHQISKPNSKAACSLPEQKFGTKHKEIRKLADRRKFLGTNKLRRIRSRIAGRRIAIIVNKSQ